MTTMQTPTLILTHDNHRAIFFGEVVDSPAAAWLQMQALKPIPGAAWSRCYPLTGGVQLVQAGRYKVIGPATKENIDELTTGHGFNPAASAVVSLCAACTQDPALSSLMRLADSIASNEGTQEWWLKELTSVIHKIVSPPAPTPAAPHNVVTAWALEHNVRFVARSNGLQTTETVSFDSLVDLVREAQ